MANVPRTARGVGRRIGVAGFAGGGVDGAPCLVLGQAIAYVRNRMTPHVAGGTACAAWTTRAVPVEAIAQQDQP